MNVSVVEGDGVGYMQFLPLAMPLANQLLNQNQTVRRYAPMAQRGFQLYNDIQNPGLRGLGWAWARAFRPRPLPAIRPGRVAPRPGNIRPGRVAPRPGNIRPGRGLTNLNPGRAYSNAVIKPTQQFASNLAKPITQTAQSFLNPQDPGMDQSQYDDQSQYQNPGMDQSQYDDQSQYQNPGMDQSQYDDQSQYQDMSGLGATRTRRVYLYYSFPEMVRIPAMEKLAINREKMRVSIPIKTESGKTEAEKLKREFIKLNPRNKIKKIDIDKSVKRSEAKKKAIIPKKANRPESKSKESLSPVRSGIISRIVRPKAQNEVSNVDYSKYIKIGGGILLLLVVLKVVLSSMGAKKI